MAPPSESALACVELESSTMADESQFGEGRFRPTGAEPEPKPDPAPPQKPRGPWLTIAALAMLALGKLKFLLIGLKALPFAKILLTSGTMLVSMAVYAWSMGIPFAIGF